MRALLFFGLVILVFIFIRFILKRLERFQSQQQDETLTPENANNQEQKMVTCEYCGVHLPQSEAIGVEVNQSEQQNRKKYFCCKAHLEAFIVERS